MMFAQPGVEIDALFLQPVLGGKQAADLPSCAESLHEHPHQQTQAPPKAV